MTIYNLKVSAPVSVGVQLFGEEEDSDKAQKAHPGPNKKGPRIPKRTVHRRDLKIIFNFEDRNIEYNVRNTLFLFFFYFIQTVIAFLQNR